MRITLSWKQLLGAAFGLGTLLTLVGGPLLEERGRSQRTRAAVETLQQIADAQTLYREGDLDGNGVYDYAPDLATLIRHGLLDGGLASGARAGYEFQVERGAGPRGEFVWWARANPHQLGVSGDVYLGINMTGIVCFSHRDPIPFDADGGSGDAVVIGS